MEIFKQGSRGQKKATSDYFHGVVFQNPIIVAPEPSRVGAIKITFEPKARTAWHTHPLGHLLFFLDIAIHDTMKGQVANWLVQVLDIDYNIKIFKNYIVGGVINEC